MCASILRWCKLILSCPACSSHASNQAGKLHVYNPNTIATEEDHSTVYTMPDGMIECLTDSAKQMEYSSLLSFSWLSGLDCFV